MESLKSIFSWKIVIFTIFIILGTKIAVANTSTDDNNKIIKVGMTTALTGPAKELGQGIKLGVEAYFHQINQSGGINGQKLELITLDDGYEPSRAAPNMRKLILEENVIAVIGNVGTPTAIVTVPIANELKTLLFGAFTGAGVLRKNPPDRYVINLRASYEQETATMVKGLLANGIKPEEIAFFTQNDGYGDAGYQGAMKALQDQGFVNPQSLPHGRYTRNTLNVEEALSEILSSDIEPKAIIMVGAYAPNAKFIKLAKKDFPDTTFLNVSFVGSHAFVEALGADAEGTIITQVAPFSNNDLPAVKEYYKALQTYNSTAHPGFVSFEGFLLAKLFVQGLSLAEQKGELNREGVINALESIRDYDIGLNITVGYSKQEHQALHTVWPTVYKKGEFVPLVWKELNPTNEIIE